MRRRTTGLRLPSGSPALAWRLLAALLALATLAGGASSPAALGQAVVRTGAALLAGGAIALGLRFDRARYRGPALLLAATAGLVAVQLVPLPPTLWQALPGRAAFDPSAVLPELAGTWRPTAIMPDAAWNALFSLTVPAAALLLVAAVPREWLSRVPLALLVAVGASSVVAAAQFGGFAADDPLINERLGFASGLFANRNHQALFLAIGIAAAAQWGATRPFSPVRILVAGALTAWFALMLLATGSRAGLLLGLVALLGGVALVAGPLRRARVRVSRRTAWIAAGVGVAALAGLLALGIAAGRADSLSRLGDAAIGEDMRVRGLPTVVAMVGTYLPIGAGAGGFATLFAAAEPDSLLKPTYFNHAHDDYLEVLIDAGIPGALLLLAALAWFARRSWQAWRLPPGGEVQRARFGSLAILLVLLASATDYPARTPLVMTVLVLAAALLCVDRVHAALPGEAATL